MGRRGAHSQDGSPYCSLFSGSYGHCLDTGDSAQELNGWQVMSRLGTGPLRLFTHSKPTWVRRVLGLDIKIGQPGRLRVASAQWVKAVLGKEGFLETSSKHLWLPTGQVSEELEEEGLFQLAQEHLEHFQEDRDICLAILSLLWSLLVDGEALLHKPHYMRPSRAVLNCGS